MNAEFVPWDVAWHEALYGSDGFYRRSEGPAGHFSTSVGGVPHAPSVMAAAVVSLARRHHLDTVIDVGAARGEFISMVHARDPGMRCVGVDIVDRPSHLAGDIDWLVSPGGSSLPVDLVGVRKAVVLAHEWLDVVPTTIAERDPGGPWHQQHVEVSTGDTRRGDPVTGAELAWLDRWAGRSVAAEVGLRRDEAFADLVDRIEHGLVVAVDYGHWASDIPTEGTMTGYRAGRVQHPVPDGSMDLTAHVHLDSLSEAASGPHHRPVTVARQHEILDELLGPPQMPAHDTARSQPSAYLQAVAEHNAHRVLIERGGFGDFWWVLVDRTG